MFDFSHLLFEKLIVHHVGNSTHEEGVQHSEKEHDLMDDQLQVVLYDFFFSHFKKEELYHFKELADMKYLVQTFFGKAPDFIAFSRCVADLLYLKSSHPKVKGGELYVASFRDILFEDELVDAVGIFKTDQKNTFIDIHQKGGDATIGYHSGIDTSKLNKGVLIFNTLQDDGYVIKVVDGLNSGKDEAKFWIEDFLGIEPLRNSVYQTKNYLNLAKEFVEETMASKIEIGKKKGLEVIDTAIEYFQQNEDFNLERFTQSVFEEPEIQQKFKVYRNEHAKDLGLTDEVFEVSAPTVKKEKKRIKHTIKLDDSIEIKLNPNHAERNNQVIERGFDSASGQYFYKLFYHFES